MASPSAAVRDESRFRCYERIAGKVWVASPDSPCRGTPDCPITLDAGLAQITMGRAWWFRKYADEQSPEDRGRYELAKQEARAKKAGLWRDGTAVPPWEWRRARE
jgi:endonuclease YncB( thermonuclease family)